MPTRRLSEPRDPDLALDKTQYRVAIGRLLNNAWGTQATATTRFHHLVIERGIDPAMEPDERQVPEIPQANSSVFRQRMSFRDGKDHSVLGELPMLQLGAPRRHRGGKASVQSIRDNGFNLMNRHHMVKHQLDIGLSTPEFAKRVHHQPM